MVLNISHFQLQTTIDMNIQKIKNNLYSINSLIMNTEVAKYFDRNLEILSDRKKQQRVLIQKIEIQLAHARNQLAQLSMIESEISQNYIASVQEVKIVKVGNIKTGNVVDILLTTPQDAEAKVLGSAKWMYIPNFVEMYGFHPETAETDFLQLADDTLLEN